MKILVLVSVIKHLSVVSSGQDFCTVAKEDDSTTVSGKAELAAALLVKVIAAVAVLVVVVDSWAAELG